MYLYFNYFIESKLIIILTLIIVLKSKFKKRKDQSFEKKQGVFRRIGEGGTF